MPSTRCKFRVSHIDQYATTRANPDYPTARKRAITELGLTAPIESGAEQNIAEHLKQQGIPQAIPGTQPVVYLNAVYAHGDPQSENHRFWEATPSGEIKLTINNAAGAEVFDVGHEYYVTFEAAD
jgi:hypothetical protein